MRKTGFGILSATRPGATLLRVGLLAGVLTGALVMARPAAAAGGVTQDGVTVTPVMTQALPDYPGKEAVMITVEYAPGAADPIHRHDAHGFIYVLEGSIVMGVKGGKEVTLGPGQAFHEGPADIHTVGRNASTTKPAKFVVVLLKEKGAPILTPVK
ncbi:quercetin dioxygenase-like cupin family protein [Cupriavidus plantarum]|nr:quercetin dioxygenase-like cupin family protein [Cupriavidus plantarum]